MQEDTQTIPGDPKASLGFSNMLREQMFMQDNPPMPMEMPEMDSQEDMTMETQEEPQEDKTVALEAKIEDKMEILRTELKDTIKTEIESIRNDIKDALDQESNDQS